MGLNSEITEALQEAFDGELADAVNVVSLVYVSSAYDPETGLVTEIETRASTRGVIEPVSNEMIDGEVVQVADTLFIILKAELAATPKIADTIEANGISYSVNVVLIDPADVAWNIVGRTV